MVWFRWVLWVSTISTIVGYLIPNPVHTNISNMYIYDLVEFYGISTIVGYLMPNPIYTYILNMYIWYDFGWVLWNINHCRSFNVKSCLYIYIEYIWFDLLGSYGISTISTIVGYLIPNPVHTYISNMYIYDLVEFYGISNIVGYLMPNPIYTYILNMYIWYDLVGLYGISTIVGHLMSNPVNTYILNIYALICLGLMAYQPL